MSATAKAVKSTALTALKSNIISAIFAGMIPVFLTLIFIFLTSVLSSVIGAILSNVLLVSAYVFLLFPLYLGLLRFFWRLIYGAVDMPLSIFYYFSALQLYKKSMKLVFTLLLKVFIVAVLVFLPVIAVLLFSKGTVFDAFGVNVPVWTANLDAAVGIINFVAVVILLGILLKYHLVPLLIVADEDMDVDEAFNMSVIISKKSNLEFVSLVFSFIGWILLSLFAIPLIFTLPYMLTAYCVYFRYTVAEYNEFANNTINDYTVHL